MNIKVLHSPSAQESYFRKAIQIQNTAFKEIFAEKKFLQSCNTLCSAGWCNSTRDCTKCALKWAHEQALKEISSPEGQEKRYRNWVEHKYGPQASEEARSIRTTDKKGHTTEVCHY